MSSKKTVHQFTSEGPDIEIGEITLRKLTDGSIWMEKEDGEGAQFKARDIELVLLNYYEENF